MESEIRSILFINRTFTYGFRSLREAPQWGQTLDAKLGNFALQAKIPIENRNKIRSGRGGQSKGKVKAEWSHIETFYIHPVFFSMKLRSRRFYAQRKGFLQGDHRQSI